MPDWVEIDESSLEASIRELARRRATVPVLVTVKASPQPSSKYGDTVCVAGTLMDPARPRWIRLYPVPFRDLASDQRFAKYSVITVRLHEATQDLRPESAKIDVSSIRVGQKLPAWKPRAPWVESLAGSTMCAMVSAAEANVNAPSLGAIQPREVDPALIFRVHGDWTDKQRAALNAAAAEMTLFGPAPPVTLEPPRLEVRLRFWCLEAGCNSHTMRIIDWELTALQAHGSRLTDVELQASISDRFMRRMFLNDTAPLIFVGNQANIARRASFTVLGVYYPKRDPDTTVPLF